MARGRGDGARDVVLYCKGDDLGGTGHGDSFRRQQVQHTGFEFSAQGFGRIPQFEQVAQLIEKFIDAKSPST